MIELLNPVSDIIRVRVKDEKLESGSIYMEDAINLYENAKKLLIATAMDISHPGSVHFGRPNADAIKFISNCRFSQTEIGSYVVSIVCPLAEIKHGKLVQRTLFSEEYTSANSLTRQITKKLITSVQRVKEEIDNGTFDITICQNENTKLSISPNFLEALCSICIYKKDTAMDISIKWAPTIKDNTADIQKVSLTHDYFEPMNTLINRIKNDAEEGIL